jgi:hypothetical protein
MKWIAVVLLIWLLAVNAVIAYAACTTNTIVTKDRVIVCTVCCDQSGNCTTTCF